jgi:radical SAM protein (TIGR01212 family)
MTDNIDNNSDDREKNLYNKFSTYLRNKYGTKVYKLPVSIPVSCPGRDGCEPLSPCIFCGDEGAGFEMLPETLPVKEQLGQNSAYIAKNYKSQKFIAYFQNFTNTYLPLQQFKQYIAEACEEDVVAIYISTRPDCVNDSYLAFLQELKCNVAANKLDIVIELGLQTVNYHTLDKLNRNHGLAEFIDAVLRIKRHGLESCAHYIVDLPWDDMKDVIEGAKILSALQVEQVKCHSLYILRDTVLGRLYEEGKISPISIEGYIERIITFLEYLDPEIVIQRLIGRAPQERTLFCNWGASWWKLHDMVMEKMTAEGRYQGKLFGYLNGKKYKEFYR